MLKDCTILGVDVETTGLDPGADRIVELGIGRWASGRLQGATAQAVWPDIPIPDAATQVNGLSSATVAGCPRLAEVLTGANASLQGGQAWMAHQADFDRAMLLFDGLRQRCDSEVLRRFVALPWLDTRILARALDDAPAEVRGYSLGELCARLDVPTGQAHRAEDDVRAMFGVWQKLLPRLPDTLQGCLDLQRDYREKIRRKR
jgi:DNA polymerase-3 subunit epsilon